VFNAAPKNFENYLLVQLQKYSINHERWALKGH